MIIKKICLDYGHGGKDPGASYMGRLEKEDNIRLGKKLKYNLENLGFIVVETRNSDKYLSLKERARYANKENIDLVISLHRNAFMPEIANGVELYRYFSGSKLVISLANNILKDLQAIGFKNRGLKKASFYILKATKAPALIFELGFIDNTKDNKIFDKNIDNIVKIISKNLLCL